MDERAERRPRAKSGGSGFSLVEVLIGAAILLFIAVGLAPLFTRAMVSNQAGKEASQVSQHATSRAEQFLQLPFDHPRLVLEDGETERVFVEYFDPDEDVWHELEEEEEAEEEQGRWQRRTIVRQYGLDYDPALQATSLTEPLPGDVPDQAVLLKEIDVVVTNASLSYIIGSGKDITVRVWKSH